MKHIRAVIYDCDGVLFESKSANLAYYNRILAAFSYPKVSSTHHDRAHLCHTASTPKVLAGLMRETDVPRALEFAAGLDFRDFIPLMKPMPHLQQALETLAGHYPLAIATNRGSSVVPVLEHFGVRRFFSVIVTCRDVVHPKPAPDMLLMAARQLERKPEECLFIGDSELDEAAARAGSLSFLGYGDRFDDGQALRHHMQLPERLNPDGFRVCEDI